MSTNANSPLVSVVIPAYDAAGTLVTTVESVFDQTIQDFEIIIVDDGSKDATVEVADGIKDPRITVISQKNGGASAARNTGIKQAKGEFVAFLDADDLWLPSKLERQLQVLNEKDDVDAVQTGAYYVNDSLEVLIVWPCVPSKDVVLETLLFQNMPGIMSTLMVRRTVFEKIGYLKTNLVILEDWELAIRLARFCNLTSIEEPLSLYRQFPGNRSRDLSIHIEPGHIVLEGLFNDPTFPDYLKRKRSLIYSTFYMMLSGGAYKVGKYAEAISWGLKSLAKRPATFAYAATTPLRRRRRKASQTMVSDEFKNLAAKFAPHNAFSSEANR
jgi:glycosyltransferase involved in cell wall biosynthesis